VPRRLRRARGRSARANGDTWEMDAQDGSTSLSLLAASSLTILTVTPKRICHDPAAEELPKPSLSREPLPREADAKATRSPDIWAAAYAMRAAANSASMSAPPPGVTSFGRSEN
jgi:hypothetical protein